ncbi:MAG TPA: PIG-L deacetylase family protein [Candidatus Acidoferrum sp.]|jgi:LmbE family N-acetylglucosaminyl deacetylase
MLSFALGDKQRPLRRVLCLGAHCDDIEIGCGGTLLRLQKQNPRLEFYWVVFSSTPKRKREAAKSAQLFLSSAGASRVVIKKFRDSYFPSQSSRIKDSFELLQKSFAPDLVFTHCRGDLHQDHSLICELTWNSFRNHLILEYEIPKYEGDLGSPNFFVGLPESLCRQKIDLILRCFESQKSKHWFEEETFRALLRLRGIESNVPEKYAEGFYCRKLAL